MYCRHSDRERLRATRVQAARTRSSSCSRCTMALPSSAAVTMLVPDRRELMAQLGQSTDRLTEAIETRVAFARQRLNQLRDRPAFRKPQPRRI